MIEAGTKVNILFYDMDIFTNKDKCVGDFLRIKGAGKNKYYCDTFQNKLKTMGPWHKDKRIRITFKSDGDKRRGRGVALLIWAGEESEET